MDKAKWEEMKQRFARELGMEELDEVTGGLSRFEEFVRVSSFWSWLVTADPSLGKWSIDERWRSLGMKHEVKNDKCVYTDLLTGKEVDFYGAWALVLKRIDKKIGGVSSEKIDKAFNFVYRKLSELMSKDK